MMSDVTADEKIKKAVQDRYGDIARRFVEVPDSPGQASCCDPSPMAGDQDKSVAHSRCCGPSPAAASEDRHTAQTSCCGPSDVSVDSSGAVRLYQGEDLTDLPESVTDASLGCGNPLAIAGLQPGEVVLDLGSGGGIDCFLAAKKVGPEGRVIGLDMTPDMIKLARRNAKKIGVTNVDFRYGEMEEMPLPDASVDVIISNCVINLSPDKDAVFREALRVLRPGGRLSISDMVVDGDLPPFFRDRLDAWAACLAGALDERVYLDKIRTAGFTEVEVLSRDHTDLDDVAEWAEAEVMVVGDNGQGALDQMEKAGQSPQDLARKVASIKVSARKPK
jgi:SAM-dependent methyltransferase